eukprot:TRINITY_DN26292_c0_g1_i1.p1 TRINITY_DN26292_c0_g1~~TRINITY_DN26292_c0_g1_i1.p1  ORF type:complete len:434 (+),score=92.14 TRINITY_DN26292_c0_g1_i1:51-1304(+)
MDDDAGSKAAADEEAVRDVLAARNHYAALGAPTPSSSSTKLSTAELRRCYLQVSVRVHPDKNTHADATRAFQRVAAAWAVLGDEQPRQRYDAELLSSSAGATDGFSEDTRTNFHGQSNYPEMSEEEAFKAFAFAAAAAGAAGAASGGGVMGAAGNFAQVLLCAQQLAKFRETGETPDALSLVSGGLAISNTLRAAGAVAHSAGFRGASDSLERVAGTVQAVSQVAAVGALAAKVPAVQQALESGRSAATERLQDLATAASGAKNRAKEWLEASGGAEGNAGYSMQAKETLGNALGGMASWAQRARQCVSEKLAEVNSDVAPDACGSAITSSNNTESNIPAASPATGPLAPGTVVRLSGLQATPELNGQVCEVVGFDETTQRIRVQVPLAGAVKLVRRERLEIVQSADSMASESLPKS